MHLDSGMYELVYSDNQYEYFNPINDDQIYFIYQGEKFDSYSNCQIRISKIKEINIIHPSGSVFPNSYTPDIDYTLIDSIFIEDKDSFQQTITYLGKNKNMVKFSYREFYKNMIRDPYTTEITYDLSESNIIGYKNFKDEIIEATNSKLTYKIISVF